MNSGKVRLKAAIQPRANDTRALAGGKRAQ
jgi:hypothetical protein